MVKSLGVKACVYESMIVCWAVRQACQSSTSSGHPNICAADISVAWLLYVANKPLSCADWFPFRYCSSISPIIDSSFITDRANTVPTDKGTSGGMQLYGDKILSSRLHKRCTPHGAHAYRGLRDALQKHHYNDGELFPVPRLTQEL